MFNLFKKKKKEDGIFIEIVGKVRYVHVQDGKTIESFELDKKLIEKVIAQSLKQGLAMLLNVSVNNKE